MNCIRGPKHQCDLHSTLINYIIKVNTRKELNLHIWIKVIKQLYFLSHRFLGVLSWKQSYQQVNAIEKGGTRQI